MKILIRLMYAELDITSNFTFLTGGSHPEEYVTRAAELGIQAIAIADENSVAGIVRAHTAAREIARQVRLRREADADPIGPPRPGHVPKPPSAPIYCTPRLIPAARIVLRDGPTVTMLPRDRKAWGNLCRLISTGRLRTEKGSCDLGLDDLLEWGAGSELLLHPPQTPTAHPGAGGWVQAAERLTRRFPGQVSLRLAPCYDGSDRDRFHSLDEIARGLGIAPVATAAPVMHLAARRKLTDVLTAIRQGVRVDDLGRSALTNAEQRMRSEADMRRIFAGHEDAVDNAATLADRCRFSLDELRYEYPSEIAHGEAPADRLSRLAHEGLRWRYPAGAPEKVRATLTHELNLIARLNYEPYFLTVHDVVKFARDRGILCQGRGSAANSVTCFALGVTSVSPEVGTMVFERFVSEARDEPPDIDVDFEHERREEVIQHIYERYGRHRAGLCATVIHYRGKRAIREVGRAMGLTDDTISALSSQLWGFFATSGLEDHRLREIGLDPADRRLAQTMALIYEIIGFPRHLSPTRRRLHHHRRPPRRTRPRRERHHGGPHRHPLGQGRHRRAGHSQGRRAGARHAHLHPQGLQPDLAAPPDRLHPRHAPPRGPGGLRHALPAPTSLGVFQVESRAQMNFLPRMRPRTFYDLVIEVAIIRPGPIQGDMVHPYLRRRNGEESVQFPSDELGQVLGKTLGVPLFQEQAMQIAIIGAGFTPEEADRLRRALATFKKHGNVSEFRTRFLKGMAANGYDQDFAERCFSQIEGFGSYGFPESHAASFALLVYASAWLKRHHPGIFACALLNAQPMGFYAPAQIVRDAREHGVTVRPVDINASYWDNVMEPDGNGHLALRLGFRQIKALSEDDATWITAARSNGYQTVEDVWRRAGVPPRSLRILAEADAFASLGLHPPRCPLVRQSPHRRHPPPALRHRPRRRSHQRTASHPPRHDARRGSRRRLRRHSA